MYFVFYISWSLLFVFLVCVFDDQEDRHFVCHLGNHFVRHFHFVVGWVFLFCMPVRRVDMENNTNLSYISDILASESFNDKIQWDHRGDVDINKDDSRPGSSTPNKPSTRPGFSTPQKAGRGIQTRPNTPHTNSGEPMNATRNLTSPPTNVTSTPPRQVHVLVLTDMTADTEDTENKNISTNLVSELSFDGGSGSSRTTPATVRATSGWVARS